MMDRDPKDQGDSFLGRWSRLKAQAREPAPTPAAAASTDARAQEPPPKLPPVDELTLDSDFRDFFHPKVDESLRRAALRKLFSDPHFNVMDGLDVYIDDYSQADPIPAEMLASLKQAQRIVDWATGKDDERAQEPADHVPEQSNETGVSAIANQSDNTAQAPKAPTGPAAYPQPSVGADDERPL